MWRIPLFPLLLLCLAAGSRQLSIKELSVPVAVEIGEDANLECKYELLKNESNKTVVKWWWTPLNSSSDQRQQLYQRIYSNPPTPFVRQHKIEVTENDGIKLLNVSTNETGIYECEVQDILAEEVRDHKKLIVYSFGSGFFLNVSVVEDPSEEGQRAALVTCEAYDVTPYPVISITLNGDAVKSSGNVTESKDMYDIIEYATVSLEKADEGEFRCELLFVDDDVPHAPFMPSQVFTAPTASTPEPEEAATQPSATAAEPNDNSSNNIGGDSWMLLTLISLCFLAKM